MHVIMGRFDHSSPKVKRKKKKKASSPIVKVNSDLINVDNIVNINTVGEPEENDEKSPEIKEQKSPEEKEQKSTLERAFSTSILEGKE